MDIENRRAKYKSTQKRGELIRQSQLISCSHHIRLPFITYIEEHKFLLYFGVQFSKIYKDDNILLLSSFGKYVD